MKKILLVSSLYDPQLSRYGGVTKLSSLQVKGFITPLSLATIAALTPDDVEVDLWDEPVHGRIDESTDLTDYDLVGISCFVHRLSRAKEIAQIFRQCGIPVAVGGPGPSSAPEQCRDDFDILFIGEAELTWPQFISDFLAGNYKSEYRQIAKPDLAISPIPRWDGLADYMENYALGAVQTTRGCPFDCDFCDVIYLHGRRQRHKPIDSVLKEIRVLQELGMRYIFFCDDNFIGNLRYAKELLREVIALNRTFDKPLAFQTQLSINVAKDEELLELLADANFSQILIGIETPNKDKTRTDEALIEIFTDFIVRWGQTFETKAEGVGERSEQLEDFHRTFLFEIADRTIAKENSTISGKAAFREQSQEMPDIKKNQITDEILKAVEQELRGFEIGKHND